MGLVHVVHVVLLLHLPGVLVLEDLRQDALGVLAAVRLDLHVVTRIILNVHASSVDGIELVLDTVASTRASAGAGGARVVAALSDGRPGDLELAALVGDDVRSLVAARLNHQALVHTRLHGHLLSSDRGSINRLPSVLRVIRMVLARNHVVHDAAVVVVAAGVLALALLLGDESHGQLTDVDGVVRIVPTVLIDQINVKILNHVALALGLDGPETARCLDTVDRVIGVVSVPLAASAVHLGRGVERGVHLLIGAVTTVDRRVQSVVGNHVVAHICVTVVIATALEEALARLVLDTLVLSAVELLLCLGRVASGGSAGGDAGDLRGVAAFSFDRLGHGVLKVDDQIFVDGIFIW